MTVITRIEHFDRGINPPSGKRDSAQWTGWTIEEGG